ncbi:hypothetical protein MTBLM1_90229 [Rhodospirillaceae bacterium LM-1]|nr:hypothetical protein MTBLM1_90229 [Rhodospirillaceae bacterium LM-1]
MFPPGLVELPSLWIRWIFLCAVLGFKGLSQRIEPRNGQTHRSCREAEGCKEVACRQGKRGFQKEAPGDGGLLVA